MKRFVTGRRLLVAVAAFALGAVPAVLMKSRTAEAFTLPNLILSYDPMSVPLDHSLHVHMVNQFGGNDIIVQAVVTTPTLGTPARLFGTPVVLKPGEGTEEAFPFANLTPPSGADRVPVVAAVWVSVPPGLTPINLLNWTAEVASSVEVLDDKTGHQLAILGARHTVVPPRLVGLPVTFCLFCN